MMVCRWKIGGIQYLGLMLETLSNVGFDSGTVKGIDSIVCFLLLLLLFPELKEKNGLSLGWVRGFSIE